MAKGPFATPAQAERYAKFVEAYLVHFNGARAVIEAGFRVSKAAASTTAARLLGDDRVKAMLEARRSVMVANTQITPEMVLQRAWLIATADPRELSEWRVANCRHCWGVDHAYQWTEGEYDRACAEARLAAERKRPDRSKRSSMRHGRRYEDEEDEDEGETYVKLPDNSGGFGFIGTKEPNPACPECFGEGVGRTILKDTRNLSPGALALYAGVKQTKEGLEILTQSQQTALTSVMRSVGLFTEGNVVINQNTVNETTNNVVIVSPQQAIDELSEIFGDAALGPAKGPAIEH